MKLAFICNEPFNILSPFQRDVSETQAASVYLAIELAKIGHDITMLTNTNKNIGAYGVRCRSINIINNELHVDKSILEPDYDAIIFKDCAPEFLIRVREAMQHRVKMYLWTSYDINDPINKGLYKQEYCNAIDGVVCVSAWQHERLIAMIPIEHYKVSHIRYAISPFFENLFIDGREFLDTKSRAPALAYTAEGLSGLEVLFESYADIKTNYPDAELSVYSGMQEYGKDQDRLERIYEVEKHLKSVKQIGSISKTALAAALRNKTILTYPATQAQTYNTDILEAMAAGLYVLTSNAGSLPEYGHGLVKAIPVEDLRADHLDAYNSQALAICQTQVHSAQAFYDYCYKQVQEVNQKHTWRVRAREWIALLNAKN